MARYSAGGNDFLFLIITGDESFLYYYEPESKQLSKEWERADSSPPPRLKQEKSVSKVLYSFFWDHEGIILKRPTLADVIITETYYANILVNKLLGIRKQRWGLLSADVIFHHDNAPAPTSHVVSSTIHNLNIICFTVYLILQICSPAIILLFLVLKDYLKRRHYNDQSSLGSSIHQCLQQYVWRWLYSCYTRISGTLAKVYLSRGTIPRERRHTLIIVTCVVV